MFARPEPYPPAGALIPRTTRVPHRNRGAESDQDEIDQRGQGSADAGSDQGVVGAEAGLRIE